MTLPVDDIPIAKAVLELADRPFPSTTRFSADAALRNVAFRHPEWSGHHIRSVIHHLVSDQCVNRYGFRITTIGQKMLRDISVIPEESRTTERNN